MKKQLAPLAKRIATLEKQILTGVNVKEAEDEISNIINSLSLVEQIALTDCINERGLLEDNFTKKSNE